MVNNKIKECPFCRRQINIDLNKLEKNRFIIQYIESLNSIKKVSTPKRDENSIPTKAFSAPTLQELQKSNLEKLREIQLQQANQSLLSASGKKNSVIIFIQLKQKMLFKTCIQMNMKIIYVQ